MANPQKENGYTPIANEILDQISKLPLSGTQLRILMVVWRFTYGFSRKEHDLSESFVSKAIGVTKRFVSNEMNKLIDFNILIVVSPSTYVTPRKIAFNKDYEKWRYRTILPLVNNPSTVEQNHATTVEQSFTTTVEQSFHQDKQVLKQVLKQSIDELFESAWKLYPNKKGKAQVSNTQKSKLHKVGIEQLAKCIGRYKEVKPDWQAYQNGSTFFNTGYVDYMDENFVEAEQDDSRYFGDKILEGGGVMT